MRHSENFNMNIIEGSDQFSLNHFNTNTEILDSVIQNEIDSRITEMGNEISARQTADTALQNITNETFKMALFNLIYPLGVTYPQYPKCPSPNDLWGDVSEWTLLNYNGAFFRASGGMANDFNAGLQSESIKAHQHGMQHYHDKGTMRILGKIHKLRDEVFASADWTGDGALLKVNDHQIDGDISSAYVRDYNANSRSILLDTNLNNGSGWSGRTSGSLVDQYGGGSKINTDSNSQVREETAPANYTIQIWKRTA